MFALPECTAPSAFLQADKNRIGRSSSTVVSVGHTNAVAAGEQKQQPRWSPYVNNGGTCLAIAGDTFAVIAADTRLAEGFRIHSRDCTKLLQLTNKVVIASSGMRAEIVTLHRVLQARVKLYTYDHRKQPSVNAVSQLLCTILYSKRFFPYYTFNILAGIDDEGKGAVYGYDAVGSFNREHYACSGTGSALIYSVLDNRLAKNHQLKPFEDLTKLEVVELAKDAMSAATERDIYTGDAAEVFLIDEGGAVKDVIILKTD